MIIDTITCHNVYNLGASLQAYALAAYLQGEGHEVQIIDYQPLYLRHYRLAGVPNPRFDKPFLREAYQIAKFPGRLYDRLTSKRKKAFDRFTAEYLPVTRTTYSDVAALRANPPEADLYIAGSDQIWNPLFRNGKDPAFFLDFVPAGKRRISYAASFAVETLSKQDADRMKRWVERLDAVSVRESSGVALLADMGIKGIQVVDPVFLLSKESWEKLAVQPPMRDYILVYDFDKNEKVKEIARAISKQTGKKIVSLFPMDWADEVWADAGPCEFLGAVQNAGIVLSNSFHATAFSLIFQKDFYVVNRTEGINARMKDLVGDLGLADRLIHDVPTAISSVDYAYARMLLEGKIAASKEYLAAQTQS